MASHSGLYYAVHALLGPEFSLILDDLFEVFLSPETRVKVRDRSQLLKILTNDLNVVYTNPDVTLRRLGLRAGLKQLKKLTDMVRHRVYDGNGIVISLFQNAIDTMAMIIVSLRSFIESEGVDLRACHDRGVHLYVSYHRLLAQHGYKHDLVNFTLYDAEEATVKDLVTTWDVIDKVSLTPKPEPKVEPPAPFVSELKIEPEPEESDNSVPQGQTMEYYKAHGHVPFIRKCTVIFERGAFAGRPCRLARVNGKNCQFFFPDDQSFHYIPKDYPLRYQET